MDYFGFSLFTLINWQDFRAARGNPDVVWPAFMMQPAFQALLPTFYDLHGSDLYRDRREIFQVFGMCCFFMISIANNADYVC